MSRLRSFSVVVSLACSCAGASGNSVEVPTTHASSVPSSSVSRSSRGFDGGGFADASVVDVGAARVEVGTSVSQDAELGACPEDMVHVEHDFCPNMTRECLRPEYDRANRIEICHAFRNGSSKCRGPRYHLDYCIDRYEFPNREGAHPPWMVSWYDANRACRQRGKRLCWDWEWTAACEGPNETPFPYGWERDPSKCNIDNRWRAPSLSKVYASDGKTSLAELRRLDQSVPSGAREDCVSGFGVFDLTGNFDEWVSRVERGAGRSKWAGLKGGAWGHVRNACRPMTTSHTPQFRYYFISFRCGKDPEDGGWRPPESASWVPTD